MISVAIQGIRGSYSEEAAFTLVGEQAEIVECVTFEEMFGRLRDNTVELAVVPVENRIVGEILSTTELLKQSGAHVVSELPLVIHHVLAGSLLQQLVGYQERQMLNLRGSNRSTHISKR